MKTIKAKVHMLPTDKTSDIISDYNGQNIPYTLQAEPSILTEGYFHLYITTDEEIKEGDWFINTGSGGHPTPKVYQANSENSKAFKEFGPYPEIRKIIATTDPKLIISISKSMNKDKFPDITLPKIPQSFIEDYCKAGGIDEVLVEYIQPNYEDWMKNGASPVFPKPKLKPDNTIVIHPVEVDWEVEMRKCKESPWYYATNYLTINGKPFKTLLTEEEFNKKWIEENL